MYLNISPEERDDLVYGQQMRICVVETGTTTLRANDAINSGRPELVKALSESQKALVQRHEALIRKLLIAR